MTKAFFWRVLLVAVLLLGSGVVMGIAQSRLDEGVLIQPSTNSGTVEEFVRASNEFSNSARLFFSADMIFAMSYTLLFTAIFTVLRQHQPIFAWCGLVLAIGAGLCDLIENTIYLTYAIRAENGVVLENPAILLLSVLTALKWFGVAGVFIAYCLAFPLETWAGRIATILMALVPIVIVLAYINPDLMQSITLVFLPALFSVLYYLWQQMNQEELA